MLAGVISHQAWMISLTGLVVSTLGSADNWFSALPSMYAISHL